MPVEINDRKKLKEVKAVDGWLSESEALLLYDCARSAKNGEIVEIGSWKGKSTICLALGARRAGKKVHAVDHHKGDTECGSENTLPEFSRNLKRFGVANDVEILAMTSERAAELWNKAKRPISLLWIDAAHDYKNVKKDFLLWEKYLVDGGTIAFHDTFFKDGPSRVVSKYILSGGFSNIRFVGEITCARRTRTSVFQKISNYYKRAEKAVIYHRRKYGLDRIREAARSSR